MSITAKERAEFEAVIGLECHVQLQTTTKAFTSASAAFGGAPNSHVDPYTLALPGTLPVLSRAAVECALKIGLATSCTIRRVSRFARKHYFYPDLPKGYQISQFDEPLCEGGTVEFPMPCKPGEKPELRSVRLTRIHMEEDAGKNTHVVGTPYSLVDYNRAGVPLVEIVSEPDIRSSAEAVAYLRAIRQIVRYLGISDGNMDEGSLRADANVSVRPVGQAEYGTKAELKNMNSFKNIEAAIEYEIVRQIEQIKRGERVVQESRLWNVEKGISIAMRSKEEAHDYRYFPEPDLPPLSVDDAWIEDVQRALPELPVAKRRRYVEVLGLSEYDAAVLTADQAIATYFEAAHHDGAPPKLVANWLASELLGRLNKDEKTIEQSPISASALAGLTKLVDDKTISGKMAKGVFDTMWATGKSAKQIVDEEGLVQVTDSTAIEAACKAAVDANPKQADAYRAGKTTMLGFFVGQVMKATQGKANPELVNEILKSLLGG
ncbi:MAG: Asp-tRNA(Asn)/Glu-tRNA(Gln) amidotransferase subunit GatB [Polyangia bacterium]